MYRVARAGIALLFISCKFVKGFLEITFLLLLISSWNFHDVCQRFLYNKEQNFSLIRQKTKNFSINPHYKNRPLLYRHVYRHDVTKVGNFYNGGLCGNSLSFVVSSWNFVPGYIKNVDTHHVNFCSKKQVLKKLSPKILWQTYMKWTVL